MNLIWKVLTTWRKETGLTTYRILILCTIASVNAISCVTSEFGSLPVTGHAYYTVSVLDWRESSHAGQMNMNALSDHKINQLNMKNKGTTCRSVAWWISATCMSLIFFFYIHSFPFFFKLCCLQLHIKKCLLVVCIFMLASYFLPFHRIIALPQYR